MVGLLIGFVVTFFVFKLFFGSVIVNRRLFELMLFVILCGCVFGQIRQHLPYEPEDVETDVKNENVFLNAKVTASTHWSSRVPKFTTDGKKSRAGDHWAGENIPVNLTVELSETQDDQ